MGDKPAKILLIENGLLGDCCATIGIGQGLRKLFPNAEISLLVKRSAQEFFSSSKWVDNIILFDLPWTRVGFAQFGPKLWLKMCVFALRLRKKGFNYVVSSRRDLYQLILFSLIGTKLKVWPPRLAPRNYTARAFSVLGELGFKCQITPKLEIPEASISVAEQALREKGLEKRNFILIHPGASYFLRRWNPTEFARLHSLFIGQRFKVAYMGSGESDRIFMDKISSSLGDRPVYFDLPLFSAIAVVSFSKALVGMDSGFSHIGAILGVPTVALYGAEAPENTGIVGSKVAWINRHKLCYCRSLHLCIPYSCLTFCSLVKKPCHAMMNITAQEVYSAVCGLLKQETQ